MTHKLKLGITILVVAWIGCSSDPPGGGNIDARPGTGGSGGAASRGGSGGVGGGGTGGSRAPDAAAGSGGGVDAPADAATDRSSGPDMRPPDARGADAAAMTIAPPRYPPPGTGSCAPGCADLRARYADALLRSQSCNSASACAFKAPGSLGCGGCEAWVSDLREVAPLANQFNDMGCYGCFFGPADGKRCHAIGCPDLLNALCTMSASGQGTCTNDMDRKCAPGVANGVPCTRQGDVCLTDTSVCVCHFSSPNWMCGA